MTVDALRPEDAQEIVQIALAWGRPAPTVIAPGAHGCVVRDADGSVLAWALLRENVCGFAVDELWQRPGLRGNRALAVIADAIEGTVARIAAERGKDSLALGGAARLDNPKHINALERRGYTHVANMYAKEIPAVHPSEPFKDVPRETLVPA